jgi:hypothetical protein
VTDDLAAGGSEPLGAEDLSRCAARLFGSADGQRLLDHLERVFLLRRAPPQSSDQELRHLEGQRSLVAHLQSLIARGRSR